MYNSRLSVALLVACGLMNGCNFPSTHSTIAISVSSATPGDRSSDDVRRSLRNGTSEVIVLSNKLDDDKAFIAEINAAGLHAATGIYLVEIQGRSRLALVQPKSILKSSPKPTPDDPPRAAGAAGTVGRRIDFGSGPEKIQEFEIPDDGLQLRVPAKVFGNRTPANDRAAAATQRGKLWAAAIKQGQAFSDPTLESARRRAKGLESLSEADFDMLTAYTELMGALKKDLATEAGASEAAARAEAMSGAQRSWVEQALPFLELEGSLALAAGAETAASRLIVVNILTPPKGPTDVRAWLGGVAAWLSP